MDELVSSRYVLKISFLRHISSNSFYLFVKRDISFAFLRETCLPAFSVNVKPFFGFFVTREKAKHFYVNLFSQGV